MSQDARIITVASTAHFLAHMFVLIFPAIVMPFSREMGVPVSEIFPAGFYMYFFYGAMALPAGYFADHWSRVGILKICVGGMSISALIVAYSQSLATLTVSMAFVGMFCGLYHPAGLGLIAQNIKKQGTAHGINGIFGNIGIAAAPLFSGLVLLSFNWRLVYILSALLGFAGLVLISLLPIHEVRPEDSHAKTIEDGDSNHKDRLKYFLILCVSMTIAGLVYRANMTALPVMMETRAPDLLSDIKQLFAQFESEDALSGVSALLVSTLFLFSMTAQYVGGKLADRADLRWAYFGFFLLSVPFLFGMSIFYGLPFYFAAAGSVFFTLGMQPIENSLVSKFVPGKWLSTGYGIKFTLVFGIGSLAVYQIAYVEKHLGLPQIYSYLTVEAMIMAAVAGLLIYASRTLPRVANN